MTYAKLPLLRGVGKPYRDPASRIVPPANHAPMQAFDYFLRCATRLKSINASISRRCQRPRPEAAYLTNAMILGGLLSLVWKSRLLMIR